MTVIVLDDSDALRKELGAEFEALGWTVWKLASLYEYELFRELGPPDVVVVDRRLPDGDGVSVIVEGGPPVVVFTGDARPVPRAAAHIVKPRPLADVVRVVRGLVSDR